MASVTATTAEIVSPALESAEPGLYEVVGGQIVEKPAMSVLASVVATVLVRWMAAYVDEQQLGRVASETLFLLDPELGLKRRPDLAFVSAERWPLDRVIQEAEAWDIVPDLAVEVISPTNGAAQMAAKIDEYFRAGVRQVWVVYPGTRKIYLYDTPTSARILQEGDDLDGGSVLAGFRLTVNKLFPW